MADADQADLTTLTVQLLSAYVANNQVPSTELAGLIQSTRSALATAPEPPVAPAPEFAPAVTVRKSLGSKDHILSMIDGKPYKTLKRHLSNHGLTPKDYRERYNLPKDYPMVAASYSEHRRAVAQAIGLGRGRMRKGSEAPSVDAAPAPEPAVEVTANPKAKAPRVAKPSVKPVANSAAKRAPKAKPGNRRSSARGGGRGHSIQAEARGSQAGSRARGRTDRGNGREAEADVEIGAR